MFKLLAGRQAEPAETDICMNLVNQMQQRYAKAPEDAEQLLQVGDAPRDESLTAAEHAAWTQLAMTILASDLAILLY